MKAAVIAFFIFLLHSGRGHTPSYGEYLQSVCSGSSHEHAVSVVVLPLETEVQMQCGGSLITMKWSVTVAKCIKRLFKRRVERSTNYRDNVDVCVIAGVNSVKRTFEKRTVYKYVEKSKSRTTVDLRHELALVETREPFQPKPNIKPIQIAKEPAKELKTCPSPETVSVIPVVKRPVGSNITRAHMIEEICRTVQIIQSVNCSCYLVNQTKEEFLRTSTSGILPTILRSIATSPRPPAPPPTTRPQPEHPPEYRPPIRPHKEPTLICAQVRVSGQSVGQVEIEAEEEPVIQARTSIYQMSGCVGAIGSPLVCNNKLIGIENRCRRGGARGDTADATFTGIDSYLDFIAETIGDPSLKKDKEPTSRASHLKAVWKVNLVAAIGLFLYIRN